MMTLERLQDLIAAYGAQTERFPEAERGPAEKMLTHMSKAERAQLLRDAAALDQALASIDIPQMPEGLMDRLAASAPQAAANDNRFVSWRQAAAMLVVGLGLGLGAGMFSNDAQMSQPDVIDEAWNLTYLDMQSWEETP